MMAATVTWIYGARLENTPERRHKVRGRNSFAFSDLRHIIAKAALSENFDAVCGNYLKALKNLSSTPCCAWLLESTWYNFGETLVKQRNRGIA